MITAYRLYYRRCIKIATAISCSASSHTAGQDGKTSIHQSGITSWHSQSPAKRVPLAGSESARVPKRCHALEETPILGTGPCLSLAVASDSQPIGPQSETQC